MGSGGPLFLLATVLGITEESLVGLVQVDNCLNCRSNSPSSMRWLVLDGAVVPMGGSANSPGGISKFSN